MRALRTDGLMRGHLSHGVDVSLPNTDLYSSNLC
jgi:hypothetical protein